MPADNIDVRTFNNWSGGPWHDLGPDVGPNRNHNYDSLNLQVYSNGNLGVRPKLKAVHSGSIITSEPNLVGALCFGENYGQSIDDGARWLWIFEDTDTSPYRLDVLTGTLTNKTVSTMSSVDSQDVPDRYTTGTAANIGTWSGFQYDNDSAVIGADAVLTDVDTGGATAITHPASWNPHTIVKHRDRYWSWGDSTVQNRIYYSVVGDVTDWTNAEFITIGADAALPIIGVWPLYDSLLIATKDMRWYSFRFTDDPQYGEIRYVGSKNTPDFSVQVAETGDSLVFLSFRNGITVVTPERLDDKSLDYVKPPFGKFTTEDVLFGRGLVSLAYSAVGLPFAVNSVQASPQEGVYEGDQMFEFVNGVWVRSLYWGPAASDFNPSIIDWFEAGHDVWGCLGSADNVTGSFDAVYVRDVCLDRPSSSSDSYSTDDEIAAHSNDATDRFQAMLWLAPYVPAGNGTAHVDQIIVDFDHWKTLIGTPAFTIKARIEHNGSETDVTLGTLDASSLSAVTDWQGERARAVFSPAQAVAGSRIEIWLEDIDHISFAEITVKHRVQEQEPISSQLAS